ALESLDRQLEGERDRGLAGEIVDLVWHHLVHDAEDAAELRQGDGVQLDAIENAEPVQAKEGIARAIARGAVNRVAFLQEEPGEIAAILAGNAEDERGFLILGGKGRHRIRCGWLSRGSTGGVGDASAGSTLLPVEAAQGKRASRQFALACRRAAPQSRVRARCLAAARVRRAAVPASERREIGSESIGQF